MVVSQDTKPKELQSWRRIAHGSTGIIVWCAEGNVVQGRVKCDRDKVSVQVIGSWC